MSAFWQGAVSGQSPSLPRPTFEIERDGPPKPRQTSEEERDSWQSPYYRKSARLRPTTDPLPWPSRVQLVNSIPRKRGAPLKACSAERYLAAVRYQKSYLESMNKRIPLEEKEMSIPKPPLLHNPDAQNIRRHGRHSTSGYDNSQYTGSLAAGSSQFSPRSHTHPSGRSDLMFSPNSSLDLGSSPASGNLDYLTRPRPESSASFLSRRNTEPHSPSTISAADQRGLEQLAADLRAKTAASRQTGQSEIYPVQPPSRVLDLRDSGRSTVTGVSRSIPYGTGQSSASNALSQARYGHPTAAQSAYALQSAMSIAGLSQGTNAYRRTPGQQRYEQWANHEEVETQRPFRLS